MTNKLRLEVLMVAMDRVTAPLKRVLGGATSTSRGLKDLREKLKALNDQQAAASGVQKQAAEYARLTNQLKVHMAVLDGMRQSGTATVASIKREESAVRKLREALEMQRVSAGKARMALNAMGVGGNLGTAQERLRADIEQTNAALDKQRQRMAKLNAAQRSAGLMAARGAGMTAAGTGMLYGGARAGHAAMGVMGQARHAATEELRINALGLGEKESSKAIQFAKDFKSYGTSKLDNLELMRDAITVFNDRHHAEEAMPILAQMKFANEAAFGAEHGADNSRKFMDMMKVIEMRGGANNREDFERNANMVQQVITATGGRVGAVDWMHVIQRGKLAAKGFDEKEFFYRLEPLVQEMGGDAVGTGLTAAYQNLYQGRTTKRAAQNLERLGLIGDYSKVKHDKVGQTSQLNPGALKGADVFRRSQFEWMEKILIPALRAKGIESEQETIDAIGSIFSNTNAGALMATMYQQRAMVQKGYELNSKAANITQLHGMAQNTPQGKEIDLQKRRDDLYAEMSNAALPGYVKLLEVINSVVRAMADFASAHPLLTKAMVYTTAGLAMLAVGLGALAIPVGIILLKGAALRMLLARLGVQFSFTGAAGAVLGRVWGWIGTLFGSVSTVIGRAFLLLRGGAGMALAGLRLLAGFLMANPIVLVIGALATAAFLLWRNWDTVKGWLLGIWAELSTGVATWWANTAAGATALWESLVALKDRFFTAGADLMDGLSNGVISRITAVRDAISTVAGDAIDWFKQVLGIHSPSRVFMELGGYVGEGAALGIDRGAAGVRAAALGMAAAAIVPMGYPGMAMADAFPSAAALQPLAPLAMTGGGMPQGPAAGARSTYQITINAAPGMDEQAIARAVTAALERRDREAASRRYSRMDDID
ncbi:phage tail protein [Paracidovorax valerianellae]|uniref:phage tail protein n=1 Tax=Paracidovorax valerianellae TaxID=187868 RepID=UPI0023036D3A|nr:phage tail protein [Paracidovorax valerianellae]MDA8444776.1 phage tail protein [Paracidovorax valerianellae]